MNKYISLKISILTSPLQLYPYSLFKFIITSWICLKVLTHFFILSLICLKLQLRNLRLSHFTLNIHRSFKEADDGRLIEQ